LEVYGCAVDPTNGDIALTLDEPGGNGGEVGIYSSPSGDPTIYTLTHLDAAQFAGYDSSGNLFIDGYSNTESILAELPHGGSSLGYITLNETIRGNYSELQWDGSYMTMRKGSAIYQFMVSGSSGTIVSKTSLKKAWGLQILDFSIVDGLVIGPELSSSRNGRHLGMWHYPGGGAPYKTIKTLTAGKKDSIYAVAVSEAPSR
jgi:hypothetical protein